MADEPSSMKPVRDGAPLLAIGDWCRDLNRKTLEMLMHIGGAPAAVSCIAYMDPDTGKAMVHILAAGASNEATKWLVQHTAAAVVAYVEVGNPDNPPPPPAPSEVN